MPKFKVVLLKHGYPSSDIERRIITGAGCEFIDADDLNDAEGLKLCADADAILVRWLKITPALVAQFPKCKFIVRYGIGFDNIDRDSCTAAGIMIGHVPTYCLDDVSSHTLALWLACVRRLASTHAKLGSGGWDDNPPAQIYRTAGRTFGLIGLGNIGRATARKLSGWGMRLLACDPYVDPALARELCVPLVDMNTLLRESDYVSMHVPLLPETRHLMDARALGRMKSGAILINTARGPVVDGNALLAALDSGQITAAGLDVFEEEPLPLDSRLRRHPRMVVTDHVAWYSEESLNELKQTVAGDVVRVAQGQLPRSVGNPEVLKRLGREKEWDPPENVKWQFRRLAN